MQIHRRVQKIAAPISEHRSSTPSKSKPFEKKVNPCDGHPPLPLSSFSLSSDFLVFVQSDRFSKASRNARNAKINEMIDCATAIIIVNKKKRYARLSIFLLIFEKT